MFITPVRPDDPERGAGHDGESIAEKVYDGVKERTGG